MDKIDRFGQLLGAMRRRVLQSPRGERPAGGAAVGSSREPGAPGAMESLRDRIRERIRALPAGEAGRDARATRIFVESVLVWEFGEAMLEDPQFASLVERVDDQIAGDESLRSQLRGFLDDLAG